MESMMTQFTAQVGFWIFFVTAIMSAGTYKLLTKQHSEQIKELSEKSSVEIKEIGVKIDRLQGEQSMVNNNFQHMSDKINRVEHDTTIMRDQMGNFSIDLAKIQAQLEFAKKTGEKNGR
jgi:chromosome segregation ATPase